MDNTQGMGIFFQEKHTETIHEQQCKEQLLPESVPYLQRGDSSKYLEQFLAKEDLPPLPPSPSEPSKKEEYYSHSPDQDFSLESAGRFNPSAFHNFQKHLTISLKHAIEISVDEATAQDYEKVAVKMWKAFRQSSNSTKKVLHYLLGQKNQHQITEAGLRTFGLHRIFEEAGQRLATQARKYLASQTLRQISEGRLKEYIDGKKLKDKSQFRRYVKIFEEELVRGFLRKRLPKEKVNELSKG